MNRSQASGWLIFVGAVLFVVACAVPALYLDEGRNGDNIAFGSPIGLACLLMGWFPPLTPFWLANPCYLIALVQFARGKVRSTRIWATTACILSLATMGLIHPKSLNDYLDHEVSVAALHRIPPPHLKAGYYLWLGAMLATAAAAFMTPVPDHDEPRRVKVEPDHRRSSSEADPAA